MGRVIALGPGGRAQAPQRDDRFRDVIDLIRERGLLGRPLLTPPCRNRDHADDVRRAIYRSARYYCSCGEGYCSRKHSGECPSGGQRIGCRADVVRDAKGKLRVQLRLYDKQEARREVVRKYGPDPSKWPYQSKAKKAKG